MIYDVSQPPYSNEPNKRKAIQTAIEDAYNAGGGVVYLPAGTYTISADSPSAWGLLLKSRVQLMGDGLGATIIKLDTSNPTTRLIETAAAATDVLIRDMTLDLSGQGDTNNRPVALNIPQSTRVRVLRVAFTTTYNASRGYGIQAAPSSGSSSHLDIQSCHFQQLGEQAIRLRDNVHDVRILDCSFTRLASGTLYKALSAISTSTSATTLSSITFANNFSDADLDLEIAGIRTGSGGFYPVTDVLLSANRIPANVSLSVVSNFGIDLNRIAAPSGYPIALTSCRQGRVSNNDIAATGNHAIFIDGKAPSGATAETPCQDLLVTHNIITQANSAKSAVYAENCDRLMVVGNVMRYTGNTDPTNTGLALNTGNSNTTLDNTTPPATRRVYLAAENILSRFRTSMSLGGYNNAIQSQILIANTLAQVDAEVTTATSGLKGWTYNLDRVALTGFITDNHFDYSVDDSNGRIPNTLAAGVMGKDSGEKEAVALYVVKQAPASVPDDHITHAPNGSLLVNRAAAAGQPVLYVREDDAWVSK